VDFHDESEFAVLKKIHVLWYMTSGQMAIIYSSEGLPGWLLCVEVVKEELLFWTTLALKMEAVILLETSIII
jgi:hypothetical protein